MIRKITISYLLLMTCFIFGSALFLAAEAPNYRFLLGAVYVTLAAAISGILAVIILRTIDVLASDRS